MAAAGHQQLSIVWPQVIWPNWQGATVPGKEPIIGSFGPPSPQGQKALVPDGAASVLRCKNSCGGLRLHLCPAHRS